MRTILAVRCAMIISGFSIWTSAAAETFETADINLRVGTYVSGGKPLSCEDGKSELEKLGFQDVQETDCGEKTYTYRVQRAGAQYEVVIAGDNGRVVRRTAF